MPAASTEAVCDESARIATACGACGPNWGESRLTAATPMDNPYRSCELTRVRPVGPFGRRLGDLQQCKDLCSAEPTCEFITAFSGTAVLTPPVAPVR